MELIWGVFRLRPCSMKYSPAPSKIGFDLKKIERKNLTIVTRSYWSVLNIFIAFFQNYTQSQNLVSQYSCKSAETWSLKLLKLKKFIKSFWPDFKVVAVIADCPDKVLLLDVAAPHLHVLLKRAHDRAVDVLLKQNFVSSTFLGSKRPKNSIV